MNFLLASSNSHKAEEFLELLPSPFSVLAAPEKIEVQEGSESFEENAFKKASAYYEKFKKPTLSDDSGLCVQALPDELGVTSARFGGDGLSDSERAHLLLEKMKQITAREAFFVCILCAYLSPEEIYFFEGRLHGSISKEYKGEKGFGYDPVFCPQCHEGKTLAMMADYKKKHSHRAQACQKLQKFFNA